MSDTMPDPEGEVGLASSLATPSARGVAQPVTGTPVGNEEPGRYQLRRELARGGQGVVHVAWDAHLGREVAFKQLLRTSERPAFGSLSQAQARFVREARITAQLDHPGIAPLYEVGLRADGSLYATQRLVRGRTLAAALAACTTLPQRLELLGSLRSVCETMAFAHRRGVIHRDLKPDNLVVQENGEAVVLDWGLGRTREELVTLDEPAPPVDSMMDSQTERTQFGTRLGTPAYMSPEQAAGDAAQVGPRSDVWSLGVILYEVLTGRRPFEGASIEEVLHAVSVDPLPPVRQVCPTAPARLASIAEQALAREPSRRQADAGVLAVQLGAWLRAHATRQERRWRSLGLAALLAAALGGGSVALWRSSAKPVPASQRVLVVVTDVENATGEAQLDSISGMLITSLEQSRVVAALTRSRLQAVLRELGHQAPPHIDEVLGLEVARKAAAQVVLASTLRRFDEVYALEVKAIESERGSTLFAVQARGSGRDSIPGLIDSISEQVRESLREPIAEVAGRRVQVGQATTTNLEAFSHFANGEVLFERSKLKEALAEYEEAVKLDPSFISAQLGIAYLRLYTKGLVSKEREVQAMEAAMAAVDRLPFKERLEVLAWKAHLDGQSEEAHRLYQELVERFPEDRKILYLAGDLFQHEGDLASALPLFQRSLELARGQPADVSHIVDTLIDFGRLDEALAVARTGARDDPNGMHELFKVHLAREEASEAAAVGRAIGVLSPEVTPFMLMLAGDLPGAEAEIRGKAPADAAEQVLHLWHRSGVAGFRGRVREAVSLSLAAAALPGLSPGDQHTAYLVAVCEAAGLATLPAWLPEKVQALRVARERLHYEPLVPHLPLLAELGGHPALADELLPEASATDRMLVEAIRKGSPATPAMRGESGDLGELLPDLVTALAALKAGRDREAIDHLRRYRTRARADVRLAWDFWLLPRARILEAGALLRLGEKVRARAVLQPVVRDFVSPDPDLPVLPELRRLQTALGLQRAGEASFKD